MKSRYIIFLSIVILLFSGCTNYSCDEMNDAYSISNCYANKALENKNISICEEITNWPSAKASCYAEIAIKTKNEDICDNIDYGSSFIDQCKDMVRNKEKEVIWYVED
jgi:hypothetical protein